MVENTRNMSDKELANYTDELHAKKLALLKDRIDNPIEIQPGDHGWIQTYTGLKFYPLSPKIEDINIIDIAHSLSMQCRFLGHIKQFYSVAQHSVLCSKYIGLLIEDDCTYADMGKACLELYALLHEGDEPYFGDTVRPLKYLPEYQFIKEKSHLVCKSVYHRFGLIPIEPKEVKQIDNIMLVTENYTVRNGLHPDNHYTVENGYKKLDIEIPVMYPPEAYKYFINRFVELWNILHRTRQIDGSESSLLSI